MTIFEITIFGILIAPTYYGLAYAIGMISAYEIVRRRKLFKQDDLDFLFYAVVIGIIVGGRLGYVVFYHLPYYLDHPLKILALHDGGMSFHGGIIGVIIGLLITNYVKKIPLLRLGDAVGPVVPIGICLGRIANYLNDELIGYVGYTGPLAMIREGVSHFPSPLLESLLEGIVLGIILEYIRRSNPKPRVGILSAAFLIGYSVLRTFAELFRLPDPQIGYIFGYLTLGQILSLFPL